jgi:hypothetical protein
MVCKRFCLIPMLLAVVAAQAGLSAGARADQPIFVWQEGRQFDGRSQNVVVPHDPKWLLGQGVVVVDFTADRLKGIQGLISKDAKGYLDGGHLVIWLDEGGAVVARMQDKTSEHFVQSPAQAVKTGVPTRLALAFGPGGMKLYLAGKMVGSNDYQGGLQGNQEPLVIGARDWASSPRAADNLDAFFAGTIRTVALYDHALDGPAIAALGPAGTALAQAAGPGTGAQQQPVQVVVVTQGPTITVSPEELAKNVNISPSITPAPQAPVAVASFRDTIFNSASRTIPVVNLENSIRQQGITDKDLLRTAIYARLMEIARNPRPSADEKAVLDWLALQVKQTRVEAARLALAEYDRWDRDPWSYQPPGGYDFPAYGIPDARSWIWLTTTPNPPVLANKSWQTYFADIVSNNGWSPLNNPLLNKGQSNSSLENVVGFPTFGTVLAYQKLYGTEAGAKILAETTARLSSESVNLPPIGEAIASPTNISSVRVMFLQNIAPYAYRDMKVFVNELGNRLQGISGRVPLDPNEEKPALVDIAKSFTKGQLRTAIGEMASGEILGNFVVSFVLSSALQEIINESIMLDTKLKLRGELVANLEKQQSAPLPDIGNLLYYDITDTQVIYAADYQPTDPVELERMMGPREVYRAFLLSTIE